MNAFWNNYRWAINIFASICVAVALFPFTVDVTAGYYMNHPEVIPVWARVLMLTGILVRVLRVPIVFVAGVVLSVISIMVKGRGTRSA